jgi:hypothetical protein
MDSDSRGQLFLTSADKLEALKYMTNIFQHSSGESRTLIVYVGDSLTDSECLQAANVGIVMSDDGCGKLITAFKRVGVHIDHITSFEPKEEKAIYWAKDFVELVDSGLIVI